MKWNRTEQYNTWQNETETNKAKQGKQMGTTHHKQTNEHANEWTNERTNDKSNHSTYEQTYTQTNK